MAMSKLINLKKWLTIEDASRHLSSIFDEPVKNYDIYRFALDGHLKLSVNLVNHAIAKKCRVASLENVPKIKALDGDDLIPLGMRLDDDNYLVKDKDIISISGVMDLMMLGNEALDIEHEYQRLTSGVKVTLVCLEGAYVQDPNNGGIYELQDHFKNDVESMKNKNNYYPAASLPNDAALVLRTRAISEFIESVSDIKKSEKPLIETERSTLLTIIAALAKEAHIDIGKTSKAGELIANMTQQLGAAVGATTIETHLKKIPQSLKNRAK